MNAVFHRIITILRKERGISQKQAAADLGVSQALLSHYEKGIRECGLDFLSRIADYYEVSTDYLLGRTIKRTPTEYAPEEPEEPARSRTSVANRVNLSLLKSSADVIYDLLGQLGSRRLSSAAGNYLMCAHYQVFRTLYNAEPGNDPSLFTLDKNHYKALTTASMIVDIEAAEAIMARECTSLVLSPDILSGYFEKGAPSLFNLIQLAEKSVKKQKVED